MSTAYRTDGDLSCLRNRVCFIISAITFFPRGGDAINRRLYRLRGLSGCGGENNKSKTPPIPISRDGGVFIEKQ